MNNEIAKALNKVAAGMPLLFKWVEMPEQFTGAELNLTPLGELNDFEPDAIYEVMMPGLIATEHKQQIKDAYKRDGMEGVREYHRKVMNEVNLCSQPPYEFDLNKN